MNTTNFLIALVGGILAASNLIIGRLPQAREYIDKLTPYQGFVGVFMLIWGAYNILVLPELFKAVGSIPVTAIAAIGMIILLMAVGFILGFGLVSKYALSKNAQAAAKGEVLRAKLAPLTGTLGFALMGCAIWLMLNVYVLKMSI